MAHLSLGLIETIGLAAAVEAADAAVKSANVVLVGYELARGDGMTVVKVQGEVGAVNAAIAAAAAAAKVNRVVSTRVIARPADAIEGLIVNADTVGAGRAAVAAEVSFTSPPAPSTTPAPQAEIPAEPVPLPPVADTVPEPVPEQSAAVEQQNDDADRSAEQAAPSSLAAPVPSDAGGPPNHGRKRRRTKNQAPRLKGE
ncbi:MAG: BMC domain-containing protein [Telmatospirillum sp.]|nr:BMC domain-containing protein [Telmatospirillum sp.]MDR3438614.1 BMC domain-containing protein [Telmatospirillum sp.]